MYYEKIARYVASKPSKYKVLSYLLDKFRERFSNGAVTGPLLKQIKTKSSISQTEHTAKNRKIVVLLF